MANNAYFWALTGIRWKWKRGINVKGEFDLLHLHYRLNYFIVRMYPSIIFIILKEYKIGNSFTVQWLGLCTLSLQTAQVPSLDLKLRPHISHVANKKEKDDVVPKTISLQLDSWLQEPRRLAEFLLNNCWMTRWTLGRFSALSSSVWWSPIKLQFGAYNSEPALFKLEIK